MSKKASNLPKSLESLLANKPAEETPKEPAKTTKKTAKRGAADLVRVRYDMPEEMREEIKKLAYDMGISISQLATFLTYHGLELLKRGDIDPAPHIEEINSPKFRNRLNTGYMTQNDPQ